MRLQIDRRLLGALCWRLEQLACRPGAGLSLRSSLTLAITLANLGAGHTSPRLRGLLLHRISCELQVQMQGLTVTLGGKKFGRVSGGSTLFRALLLHAASCHHAGRS